MKSLAQETRQNFPRSNVTPVWLLCYWRLLRGPAKGDYAIAFHLLLRHLPTNCYRPTAEECALVLVDNRLV